MSTSPAPFDRGEAERAAKAMFGNQALHRPAAAMAGCHPRALDYIRQAPVIVLSANAGKTGASAARSARNFAGPPMRMLCERGAKLREVMSFYGCGMGLRRLTPSVLHPVRWDAIYHLGRLNPSTLAQIIPPVRKDQDVWLRSLTIWGDQCERRVGNRWFQFEWAASALVAVRRGEEGAVETVADLAIAAARDGERMGAVFDLKWTFAQARAAAERWHAALGRLQAEKRVAQGLGVSFTETVDYAPFSNEPSEVDGFTFVPLRSCEALYEEGAAMRHCVASYSREVMGGRSRIFSIRRGEVRVATLEIARLVHFGHSYLPVLEDNSPGAKPCTVPWRIVQLKGACNSRPAAATVAASGAFLKEETARSRTPISLTAAFPEWAGSFSEDAA